VLRYGSLYGPGTSSDWMLDQIRKHRLIVKEGPYGPSFRGRRGHDHSGCRRVERQESTTSWTMNWLLFLVASELARMIGLSTSHSGVDSAAGHRRCGK
jgi:hypothetical protein